MSTSRSRTSSAMAQISGAGITPPVGFWGEWSTIIFMLRADIDRSCPRDIFCDGFAQLGQALRWSVVCPTFVKRGLPSFDDVARRGEIRLADLEMNDVPASRFERTGAHQHLEGGLCADAGHACGEFHFFRKKGMPLRNSTNSTASPIWARSPVMRAVSRRPLSRVT